MNVMMMMMMMNLHLRGTTGGGSSRRSTTVIPTCGHNQNGRRIRRHILLVVALMFMLWSSPTSANSSSGFGGELMTYTTPLLAPNVTHRQNVCDRYEAFRAGKLELRNALAGLELHPLISKGDYFLYDDNEGIATPDPGLMAELLDELASRGDFTWRQSFSVLDRTDIPVNTTFTDLLAWAVDTYDVAINWWDQSVERMERGVAYIEPWFDGSVILIDKREPVDGSNTINLLNWLRPFETQVWVLTLATIIVSGLVYQFIEYLHDEREARPWYQWISDNMYLSALNFTQIYEYAPNSFAGRIYGVSMGIWALVMTATYTANLANLFVEEGKGPTIIDSIDQAILLKIPICTYRNTNADFVIREKYANAIRVPKSTELETYQALQRGECGLVAGYLDNWLTFQGNQDYNPTCDLQWVGRTVETIKSGFAVKADAGYKCTSLIRDVINLHLTELMDEGMLGDAWERHRSRNENIDCETYTPENEVNIVAELPQEGRRTLRGGVTLPPTTATSSGSASVPQWRKNQNRHRQLKGGGSAAASSSGTDGEGAASSSLNLQQMLGCFVLHWGMLFVALIVGIISSYMDKKQPPHPSHRRESIVAYHQKDSSHLYQDDQHHQSPEQSPRAKRPQRESIVYRKHGPIIGMPPPVNTSINTSFAIRNRVGPFEEEELSEFDHDDNDDDTDDDRFDGDGYDKSRNNNRHRRHNNNSKNTNGTMGQSHYNHQQTSTIPSGNQQNYQDPNSSTVYESVNELVAKLHKDYQDSQKLFASTQRESQRLFASTQRDWRASHNELQSQMSMVVSLLHDMQQGKKDKKKKNHETNETKQNH